MAVGDRTLEDMKQWYHHVMEQADPRVQHMPLMQGPERIVAIISLYLLVATQGSKVMAPFKPWNLKGVLIAYNLAMVALATAIFSMCMTVLFGDGFNISCDTVDKTMAGQYGSVLATKIGWLFMFMKIIEYSDTVFFILRKKFTHVTFLHVYHHSSVTVVSWVVFKFVPGGQSIILVLVNSFVHMVMYTYYTLAAMGPHMQKYLWWKRYLTILQISQFVVLIGQTAVNAIFSCNYPEIVSYIVAIYVFSIFLLFLNFYCKTYLANKNTNTNTTTNTNTNTNTNINTNTKTKAH